MVDGRLGFVSARDEFLLFSSLGGREVFFFFWEVGAVSRADDIEYSASTIGDSSYLNSV